MNKTLDWILAIGLFIILSPFFVISMALLIGLDLLIIPYNLYHGQKLFENTKSLNWSDLECIV